MVTPFSGGSRVIQEGLLKPEQVWTLCWVCFGLGLLVGLVLVYLDRPWTLLVGGAGIFGAWIYSSPPFYLMSRALGEVVLFLVFGPVLTLGAGYVFTGNFGWEAFVLGLPTGWIITAVLWINQFPDSPADQTAGKRNLVVRLGNKRSRWVYAVLILAPYPTLLVMVHLLGFSPWLHLGWISLPMAWRAIRIAWWHYQGDMEIIRAQALTILTHLSMACLMLAGLVISLWV
jgi:1,4-dihydroxy-2-naphthoate octaprenyltransferase